VSEERDDEQPEEPRRPHLRTTGPLEDAQGRRRKLTPEERKAWADRMAAEIAAKLNDDDD
jgi:hypothetical protein